MRQDHIDRKSSMSSWSNSTGRRTLDAPGEHTTYQGYEFPWLKYNPDRVCIVSVIFVTKLIE